MKTNKFIIGEEYKLFSISSFLATTNTTIFKVIDLLEEKPIIKIMNNKGNYERTKKVLSINNEMIIIPLKNCVLKADTETNRFMGNAFFNFINTEEEIREQLKLNIVDDFKRQNYINMVNNEEYIKVNI